MLVGKRVLVVEDETLVSMLVEDALLDAGAEVVVVATASEALRLLAEGPIDAAVLDCNLAGVSVTPVADKAAALGVPFVFATGYGDLWDRGQHTDAPIIAKPFALDELVSIIVSCLRDPA